MITLPTVFRFAGLLVLAAAATPWAADEPWRVSSTASRTALLELYTSEGCSSCPPADRWLAELAGDSRLWTDVVPVAFHVTYWDGLGWRDRFADPAYDRRQHRVAGAAGSIVYTPGVFLDGREWRGWRGANPVDSDGARPGEIELTLAAGAARVSFAPTQRQQDLRVKIAWLLGARETAVERGENRGRTLHHAFVVHHLSTAQMAASDGRWDAVIAVDPALRARSRGLAVWVEDADGRPLQATGGWF